MSKEYVIRTVLKVDTGRLHFDIQPRGFFRDGIGFCCESHKQKRPTKE